MLAWLTMACSLVACTDRRPEPTTEPYVIRRDGGGQLISAEADRAMLLAWGGRVEIRGYCHSACIIFTMPATSSRGPSGRYEVRNAVANGLSGFPQPSAIIVFNASS